MRATATLPVSVRDVNPRQRKVRFVASDETVDRYGTVLDVGGWDLANFRRNPVFLFGHEYRNPSSVMGRVTEVQKDRKKRELVADVLFMPADINPVAAMVFEMYTHDPPFLNAVSVGFIPHKAENVAEDEQDDQKQTSPPRRATTKFTKLELLEISAVTVPANPNAVKEGFDGLLDLACQNGVCSDLTSQVRTVLDDEAERRRLDEATARWAWHNGLYRPSERQLREEPAAAPVSATGLMERLEALEQSLSDRLDDDRDMLIGYLGEILDALGQNDVADDTEADLPPTDEDLAEAEALIEKLFGRAERLNV